MKRMLWGLGFILTSAAAQAQNYSGPAAVLGAPRAASLGMPVPVQGPPPAIQPTNYVPIDQPTAGAPMSNGPAFPPYRMIAEQKPMPTGPVIVDEGKFEPLPAPFSGAPPSAGAPAMPTTVVDLDQPLYQGFVADNTPAFLRGDRFRFSAEYLMWWTNGYSVPPLLTTGPTASNGIPGNPGVSTLFGNQDINNGFSSGLRTGFEWWFGPCQLWAFDGHFFFLAQNGQSANFGASGGSPLLARPFFDLNAGAPSAELVAFPGFFSGGVNISSTTSLWGADINLRRKLCEGCNTYFDGMFGYRFLNLDEQIGITEQSAQLPPVNPALGVLSGTAFDRFRTTNQFSGGQLGAVLGCNKGNWSFEMRSTVALGETSSIVTINGGQSIVSTGGIASSTPGGLLALDSNSGRFSRNLFAVVPELNLNIGYNVCQCCRIYVGYDLLYWSAVLRPGNQIDPYLDVNRIPNFPGSSTVLASPHPIVPLSSRDFVAQGINFGLMFHW
jgi:hypothetical protein